MFDAVFAALSRWVARRERWVFAALAAGLILSLFQLPRLKIENNLENLLPAGPGVMDKIRFLRQSGFSDRVILSLSLPHAEADPDRLAAAVDRLAATLPGPWVSSVETGIPEIRLAEDWEGLLSLTPQMTDSGDLERLRKQMTPEEADHRVRALVRRLLTPGSSMGRMLATDPLGLGGARLNELQALTAAFGYRVKPYGRHLLSEDRRYALLMLRTPVPVPDGFGSRSLITHIEQCVAASPDRLVARVIAGHRHTLSNEEAIRGDLGRVGGVAAIGFILLLFGVFRDPRAGLIFLAPMAALLLAVAVASVVFASVSHFLLGMSVVLAGISMDYAIHVYVAHREIGPEAVLRASRPVLVGAATTAAVFFTFFFSSVPGYSQLAFFSIFSLFACLVLSLFLLPRLVQTRSIPHVAASALQAPTPRGQGLRVALWMAALLALAGSAARLQFQRDIAQFDGSSAAVLDDEAEFHRIWGGDMQPAMLVVEGARTNAVWSAYESVSRQAAARLGAEPLLSLAPYWPSAETRMRRLTAWRQFWSEQGPGLRNAMESAAAETGFAPDAFAPFYHWVEGVKIATDWPASGLFGEIRDRFFIAGSNRVWAIAYCEDTPENRKRLTGLEGETDGIRVRLISRGALSKSISDAIAGETRKLSLLAGGLILIPLFLLTRNVRRGLLALAPVATAAVAIAGALPLAGRPLTAASLIAAMIVMGLVIDYGVYVVYDEERQDHADPDSVHRFSRITRLAIHLSAGTTLIGAGALLRARHPVMFDIGYTLVVGVTAGYVCALWALPSLCRLTRRARG